MNTPRSIDIEITNKCNLRCKHCLYFSSEAKANKDLSTHEWLMFFKELNRCAITEITLSGGEPFHRKDLKEIIKGIVDNNMRYSILTNGTLINDEIAAFIASTKRCNFIQVSIDGSSPEIHDKLRGFGAFDETIRRIKIVKKYNLTIKSRVTIFKENIEDLGNIAELLLEELGLNNFSTNYVANIGQACHNTNLVQLSINERSNAIDILYKLRLKYGNRITGKAGPIQNLDLWLEAEKAILHNNPPLKGEGYLSSCMSIFYKLAVRADGVIVPCTLLSHIKLGHINNIDLKNVWLNHPELKKLRVRSLLPLKTFKTCKDCKYLGHCRGGCPAEAYIKTKSINNPSPDSCLKLFLENGGKFPNIESI